MCKYVTSYLETISWGKHNARPETGGLYLKMCYLSLRVVAVIGSLLFLPFNCTKRRSARIFNLVTKFYIGQGRTTTKVSQCLDFRSIHTKNSENVSVICILVHTSLSIHIIVNRIDCVV